MNRFTTPDTFAVWSKNNEIRYNSTSGGAFSEFAKEIIAEDGIVIGAKYNDNNTVEHAAVDNIIGIEELRQSKYLSSSLSDVYIKAKVELEKDRLVAFCGSPCQVGGLYSFLGKDYDNLFTMDFICRGMNSPKAFKAWLFEIEKQEGSKVRKIWFKYKDGGWKTSPKRTRLDFEDGSFKVFEGENNLYMNGYLTSNLYIRPCCGDCQFKGVPRKSDVTLADFWGIEKGLDDDKGTSMVLINSEKGKELFSKIRNNMEVYKKDFDTIFTGNPMFSESVIVPEKAHDFLTDLDNLAFSTCLKKYGGYPVPIPLWRKIVRKGKYLINKITD